MPGPVPAGSPGRVVFIGAGPGSADLITVRGARALGQASVVLADALVDPALREYCPDAQWIHVGKRGFQDSTPQAEINRQLVAHALAGHRVARLKGGDPSVFGRLEEEIQALLAAAIDFEVIPGVTAALAAAAAAGRPLTRRGSGRSVSLTTAMTRDFLIQPQRAGETQVFYMAGRHLPDLARHLLAQGWPLQTRVYTVSRAGWPDQKASEHALDDLERAADLHAGRPTVVTIGVGAAPLSPCTLADHHASPDANA
ncbi:uroporphyrinogen-III C-methyltransferase [Ideonella livida]|uniref:uroporphyrinogen-III C-methyltransferase n=1 Tax=Ideonella livida TaxID=2707176 RepID=UPI001EF18A25|nr:uroporphyrinogen-III C-methyltransferase [Ideonella livida]